jgi:TolB-like protein/Tfp pilus assembly protein PilF
VDFGRFFAELRRRNVYKVAAAYAVVAWLTIQIATQVFPFFGIPNWAVRLIVLMSVAGFPISTVIAWFFELTPEGVKRADAPESVSDGRGQPRAWIYVLVIAGVCSIGMFFAGQYSARRAQVKAGSVSRVNQKSIAVLPFNNLSRDPDNAYFTEGVQDEILARLAKVADLKVISRTSTQRFKHSPDNLPQIAEQLGVANVLEGTVQKEGDRVLVNVKLIRAATDTHLWGESFDRKLTDIFAVEGEIATRVASELQAKLTGSEQTALAIRSTENPEAYQLYLKGRYFWNKRTGADLTKAIDYFEQAIAEDPKFALAYAGLADAYVLLSGYAAASPKESLPKAKQAAEQALLLDNSLGEAHASLGQALIAYEFNFAEGEREFQQAIELSPNYATARHWYAESVLTPLGRFDEAVVEIRRALRLDPLSVIINADFGTILFSARRYDEAIEQLNKTLEMDPRFYYARWALGEALEMKGRTNEAIAEYEKAIELSDDPLPSALLAHLYARTDRKDKAREILARLHEASKHSYVTPYLFTLIHVGLGENDQAMEFLEKTYDDRDGYSFAFIKVDPFLDPLRGDPRFEAFAKKVFAVK